jgi:hypothetical protein
VDGCPVSPDKTKKLLERIAFVRVTHYGSSFFLNGKRLFSDSHRGVL